MTSAKPGIDHRLMLQGTTVYCRLCDPPQRLDIPAGVFYRLRDMDQVTCPNGHQGTLLEYKHAAAQVAAAHGPFIRYDHHPADWLEADGS
ncbi:MAG TPA: hypothetical protein VH327_03190 [Gammaproteobacteria bacterium]|jgi:hypothetical protein|nr:hypothetical protein [Gammaproteobacteria bacterium]